MRPYEPHAPVPPRIHVPIGRFFFPRDDHLRGAGGSFRPSRSARMRRIRLDTRGRALDPGWIVCILGAKYCTRMSTYVWSQRGVTIDGTRHSSIGGVAVPWAPARLHRHRAGSCRRPRWLERLFALFARRRSPPRIYVNYSGTGVVWYDGILPSFRPWFVVVCGLWLSTSTISLDPPSIVATLLWVLL